MNDVQLSLPEQRPEVPAALERARAFKIVTADDFRVADAEQVTLQKLEKMIVGDFKPSREAATKAFNAAKEATSTIKRQEESHTAPILEARKIWKEKMWAWSQEQERERRRKEAEAQEKARKLAEEQALEDAENAEKAGDGVEAERIISAPVQVAPVVMTSTVPKAATVLRSVPDRAKIEAAVQRDKGNANIPGVRVFQTWQYEIHTPANVPEAYRRPA